MRWLASPLSLLIAACGTNTSPAPSMIGHYSRTRVSARDNPDWRGIVGEWDAEYRADGHLIVHGAGMTVDSLWRLDGDILTLNDVAGTAACRLDGVDTASARYRVHFKGDELRLEPLRDECAGRRSVILSHPLRRVR